MSDPDKLQKLFEAALRTPLDDTKTLTRAFPHAHTSETAPAAPVADPTPVVEIAAETESTPTANVGLDEESSRELGILLDEQMKRKARRHRRELIGTCAVMVTVLGGSVGWFVQSPARTVALGQAIRDIRSVGDIGGMVANYRSSLDKIAAHSKNTDLATESMGVSASLEGETDVNMDAEMRSMMIGGGKTTGERNSAVTKSLGKMVKQVEPQATAY